MCQKLSRAAAKTGDAPDLVHHSAGVLTQDNVLVIFLSLSSIIVSAYIIISKKQ